MRISYPKDPRDGRETQAGRDVLGQLPRALGLQMSSSELMLVLEAESLKGSRMAQSLGLCLTPGNGGSVPCSATDFLGDLRANYLISLGLI